LSVSVDIEAAVNVEDDDASNSCCSETTVSTVSA
jgi:hypothetical protein